LLDGVLRLIGAIFYPILWALDWVSVTFFSSRSDYLLVRSSKRKIFLGNNYHNAESIFHVEGLRVTGHGWKKKRHVCKLEFQEPPGATHAFMKKEYAGSGWLAHLKPKRLMLHEARVLGTLEREGIPAPKWIAVGNTFKGDAFLITEEIPDTVTLKTYLAENHSRSQKKEVLRTLACSLARMHTLGFCHPDLYSKHVLVNPESRKVFILDWQRSVRIQDLPWVVRCENLARLHATIEETSLSNLERLAFLSCYLEATSQYCSFNNSIPLMGVMALTIEKECQRLLKKRHIREKRYSSSSTTQAQNWIYQDRDHFVITSSWDSQDKIILDELTKTFEANEKKRQVIRKYQIASNSTLRAEFLRFSNPTGILTKLLGRKTFQSPMHWNATTLYKLQRHGVQTGKILALGSRKTNGFNHGCFLLTREPLNSVSLEEWLQESIRKNSHDESRKYLLQAVGKLISSIHKAGFVIRDGFDPEIRLNLQMNLAPYLASANALQDASGIDLEKAMHDKKACRKWLRKMGTSNDEILFFLKGYSGKAGFHGYSFSQPNVVQSQAQSIHNSPANSTSATVVTSVENTTQWTEPASAGNEITTTKSGNRNIKHFALQDWKVYFGNEWYNSIMDVGVTDRFHSKQGRSVGRLIFEAGDGKPDLRVYLKRHYDLPAIDGLMGRLFPNVAWSPALQEYQHLEWARQLGIKVPEPVAVLEIQGPGNKLQSALAIRELEGMLALHEAIPLAEKRLDKITFRKWKKSLIAEMARMSRILHDRHWFHKDLYLCHFYIPEKYTFEIPNWRNQVWMIDLHRLGHHPWTSKIWRIKDLAQLVYSSEISGVDNKDRLTFWRFYRELGPKSRLDTLMLWVIRFKWQRYRSHNLKKKGNQTSNPG